MSAKARRHVLAELEARGVLSMTELHGGGGIHWAALYDAVRALEADGVIGTRLLTGRPQRRLVWLWATKRGRR